MNNIKSTSAANNELWPQKTRELHNHHFDSTIWNEFGFRDDDIIISTYAKSGTTWLQQIVSQLIFSGQEEIEVADISPWLDLRFPDRAIKLDLLENQKHRRFIKTHLPLDALVYSPKAKYIYVGRDGRDMVWSLYNHHRNANQFWYDILNDTPGRVGPKIEPPNKEVREYFLDWLNLNGYPFWPYFENIKSWWEIRHLPNILFIHYNNLKKDLEGQIKLIADFLDISIPSDTLPLIVEHCSFDYMKKNADLSIPLRGAFWDGGAQTFIYKGTNGRWKDILSEEECKLYEQTAINQLGEDCANWLETGVLD